MEYASKFATICLLLSSSMLRNKKIMTEKTKLILDSRDKKILTFLQQDAKLTNADLADKVGLSPTPCLRRVKRLEDAGYIRRYKIEVDRHKFGYPVMAFVQISMTKQVEGVLDSFEKQICEHPNVINCYLATGESDYLLQVVAKDLEDYARIARYELAAMQGVETLKTTFAIKNIVENSPVPIAEKT